MRRKRGVSPFRSLFAKYYSPRYSKSMPEFSLSWLLNLLVRRGLIDATTQHAVEIQAPAERARILKQNSSFLSSNAGTSSARYHVSPVELVAAFGLTAQDGTLLDDDRLTQIIAVDCGMQFQKIDPLALDMKLITAILSRPFALRHVVLPLRLEVDGLCVAVENPFDLEIVDNLKLIINRPVLRVLACKRDIYKCILDVYGFRKSVESAAQEAQKQSSDSFYDFEQLVHLRSTGEIEGTDQHIVNAVDYLLNYAFEMRASDIHIEPRREASQVRLRIDGVLHDVHTIPRRVHGAVLSRIKTLARLDIAERRKPQDGRIKTSLNDKSVELRVSTLPVAFGEKAVIRVFDPDAVLTGLADLGLNQSELATFERWIAAPHGLILVTGPTGSGKTTTLYTTLEQLADASVNITSIEDPIEMVTDHFNQVAVQPKAGIDFAAALRSILRQDPDIIMIGEIRDAETAEMAVQAALTGHLVLSTLHTNDAVSAVTRLKDLKVPSFLLGSTLVGVIAQRLMRKLCLSCRTPVSLSADQLLGLGLPSSEDTQIMGPVGCVACRNTGYLGRIGIFEMLDSSQRLADAVVRDADSSEYYAIAKADGMQTLRAGALSRLVTGVTSFEEVVRIVGAAEGKID